MFERWVPLALLYALAVLLLTARSLSWAWAVPWSTCWPSQRPIGCLTIISRSRTSSSLFAAREPWRGVLFCAALVVLLGLYAAVLRIVARAAPGRDAVLNHRSVDARLLRLADPHSAGDVAGRAGYVFKGRIAAVLRQNPFAHLYNEFAADPFYFCVTFHNLPATTGYGLLWVAIQDTLPPSLRGVPVHALVCDLDPGAGGLAVRTHLRPAARGKQPLVPSGPLVVFPLRLAMGAKRAGSRGSSPACRGAAFGSAGLALSQSCATPTDTWPRHRLIAHNTLEPQAWLAHSKGGNR